MKNLLYRNKKYTMNKKLAASTLNNVLSACDRKMEVPFDKIILRNRVNYFSDHIYLFVTAILLLCTLMLPILFPHADNAVFVKTEASHELSLSWHSVVSGQLYIGVDGGDLDVTKTYMQADDGTYIMPISYDSLTHLLIFPYKGGQYNIFIEGEHGESMHLLIFE